MTTFRILIVVVLQTLALAYMIFDRQSMLDSARVVTLKVIPVDPRDIFRGDYVILNYEISRLDVKLLAGEDTFSSGDYAFVTLTKTGNDWKPVAIHHNWNPVSNNSIVIRAVVNYSDDPGTQGAIWVNMTYGIESYFVPQGTGHAIEEVARKGALSIDVAIDNQSRAAIKAIRKDGKVFYVEGIL